MNQRQKNVVVFEDTMNIYRSEESIKKAIVQQKKETKLYLEEDEIKLPENENSRYEKACTIIVSKKRTLEAAEGLIKKHPESKVAVLNFASATNPGGGVIQGSSAQEESICRCSTLYPVLNQQQLYEDFYGYHRMRKDVLYTNRCIYTPKILVFKSDSIEPTYLEKKDWYAVDVITCAAPNLRMNEYNVLSRTESLAQLISDRIERILQVAIANQVDCLILGAFGCGAFCNPVDVVAEAFAKNIEKYSHAFQTIEFAIYCKEYETENYEIFQKTLIK